MWGCINDTEPEAFPVLSTDPAMSSYLFIVKYELPEVIRAFLALEENSGWVSAPFKVNLSYTCDVYRLWPLFNLFAVNGTWMETTWWCLSRSESFCLCLSLKIWVSNRIEIIFSHWIELYRVSGPKVITDAALCSPVRQLQATLCTYFPLPCCPAAVC